MVNNDKSCSSSLLTTHHSLLRLPAEPVADRLAHDELLVDRGNPVDLLKMRDALAPGAWHFGDVGAPEQPARAEGVVHGAIVLVQRFERISVVRVVRAAGQFDGDRSEEHTSELQ